MIISLPLILIGPVLTLFPEKIPNNSGKKCDADVVAKELESPFTFTEWKRESLAFAKRVARNKIYLFNLGSHMFKVKRHIFNRFALMEAKMALVELMRKFNLNTCDKTPDPLPVRNKGLVIAVQGDDLWLNLSRREK